MVDRSFEVIKLFEEENGGPNSNSVQFKDLLEWSSEFSITTDENWSSFLEHLTTVRPREDGNYIVSTYDGDGKRKEYIEDKSQVEERMSTCLQETFVPL